LFAGRSYADPHIAFAGGTQFVAKTAEDGVHRLPAFDILRGKAADFGFALVVVVPELNTAAVKEWDEEAIDGGGPGEAALNEIELIDDKGMEQAGEVGAGRHADVGEWLFDGASAADALAAFEDENASAGAGEIGGTGESVVAGSD
jgi:hypothetical protein